MKKYGIEDMILLLKNSGLSVIKTEGINVNLVDRKRLEKYGKRKKSGTFGDIDIIAFIHKTLFLIEFTCEKGINNKDFDNFMVKTRILLDNNRKKLKEFIKKGRAKHSQDQKLKRFLIDKDCEVKALYVNPTLKVREEETLKERISKENTELVYVWGEDIFEYFKIICNITRNHSKYELFSYFGINPKHVLEGRDYEKRAKKSDIVSFVKIEKGIYGAPMYTFKISPSLLLDRVYVLRNEGWRSDSFQRMILPSKLGTIRKYILNQKGAQFANNIIISLAPNVNKSDVLKTNKISLPLVFCSLCILDGQHRLLAFTQNFYGERREEEKRGDKKMSALSKNTDILVTLIAFEGSDEDILKKQTELFLDINSNQTKIKKDFIFNLKEITEPLSPESIGNKIIKYLNMIEGGVFEDKFEVKSYKKGKIKRSSIVSWGLKELVDSEKNLLFSLMGKDIKQKFKRDGVSPYVQFCGKKLEKYFKIIKAVFIKKYKIWDTWRESKHMLLSTSSIVSFLRLYRHFIISKTKQKEIPKYLEKINVNFNHKKWNYSSSQWGKLEAKMFYDIRKSYNNFGKENLIPKKHRK